MKNKPILLLGFAALFASSLAGCGQAPANNNNSGDGEENKYSQVLKDCATQIMRLNSSQPSSSGLPVLRGFTPQAAPGQALAFPAVYLYWSGLINEIEGVDIVGKAVQTEGTYKFNGMGGMTQQITFDLSVDFDEANNKFTFLGRQNIPNTQNHSNLVLTCNYNFTSKEFGGFTVAMIQGGTGTFMRYSNNVFEMFSYGSNDGHETDPDFLECYPPAETGINTLNSRMATEMVLSGEKLTASRNAFVAASDYCDEITDGTDFDVEIYNG